MMTNSPVPQAAPITAIDPPQPPKPKISDLERIAKQYPEFTKYIRAVIKKYDQFHPSGTPIEGMTEEERMKWWGAASCIVKEFEALENMLIRITEK